MFSSKKIQDNLEKNLEKDSFYDKNNESTDDSDTDSYINDQPLEKLQKEFSSNIETFINEEQEISKTIVFFSKKCLEQTIQENVKELVKVYNRYKQQIIKLFCAHLTYMQTQANLKRCFGNMKIIADKKINIRNHIHQIQNDCQYTINQFQQQRQKHGKLCKHKCQEINNIQFTSTQSYYNDITEVCQTFLFRIAPKNVHTYAVCVGSKTNRMFLLDLSEQRIINTKQFSGNINQIIVSTSWNAKNQKNDILIGVALTSLTCIFKVQKHKRTNEPELHVFSSMKQRKQSDYLMSFNRINNIINQYYSVTKQSLVFAITYIHEKKNLKIDLKKILPKNVGEIVFLKSIDKYNDSKFTTNKNVLAFNTGQLQFFHIKNDQFIMKKMEPFSNYEKEQIITKDRKTNLDAISFLKVLYCETLKDTKIIIGSRFYKEIIIINPFEQVIDRILTIRENNFPLYSYNLLTIGKRISQQDYNSESFTDKIMIWSKNSQGKNKFSLISLNEAFIDILNKKESKKKSKICKKIKTVQKQNTNKKLKQWQQIKSWYDIDNEDDLVQDIFQYQIDEQEQSLTMSKDKKCLGFLQIPEENKECSNKLLIFSVKNEQEEGSGRTELKMSFQNIIFDDESSEKINFDL